MAITPLPTPPSRDDAANFSSRADAFLSAIPTFAVEANDLAAAANDAAATASTKADEAAASAAAAAEAEAITGNPVLETVTLQDADNTATLKTHVSFQRGTGAGVGADIVSIGDGVNGVSSVGMRVNKSGALQLNSIFTGDEHRLLGSAPVISFYNQAMSARRGYIQHNGNNIVIFADAGYPIIDRTIGEGQPLLDVTSSGAGSFTVYRGIGTGWNNALTVAYIAKNNTTGRSANAAGTINASGSDPAEFHFKAVAATIAKGQIVGLNDADEVTDRFDDAIMFGIKSTDPHLVGGDKWGTEQALGLTRPVPPAPTDAPEGEPGLIGYDAWVNSEAAALAAFESDKAAFEAAHEAARVKHDRISYGGRVPAIISGAVIAGQYVEAVRDDDGGILAVCSPVAGPNTIGRVRIANPTEEQLRRLVNPDIPIDPLWTAIILVIPG